MELVKWQNGTKPSFSNLLSEFFNNDEFDSMGGRLMASTAPAVNIRETENEFILEVAAPGMQKKDFDIQVSDDNLLSISCQTTNEHEENEESYRRKEFSYSSFNRSFALPDWVDGEKTQAKYKDGMLLVSIPKKEEAKRKPPINIQVK